MPEPKQYRVVVSKRAAFQLRTHSSFAAQLDERYAYRLMDDFQKAADSLSHMPHRAPPFTSDLVPDGTYRKLLFGKWYLLIYKVKDDTVYIEYVVDGRQDYAWLIQ